MAASAATLALGAALPAVRSGPRGRGLLAAAAGVSAVLATRASGVSVSALGFDPARTRDGVRWGGGAATAVAAGYVVAVTVPGLRAHFVDEGRAYRPDFYEWIGLHIPVGTVVAEELLFRSALTALVGPVPQA
ncbi:MAG: CPBP family intramembrane glutamic endopeptidase, partial [Rhodococcus sp. (in: high G+C Gram-positive bacteria)]